jgi:DNA-binding NtrC family response regulator
VKTRRNILVIDDEEDMLDSLKLNLTQSGYECSTARTGQEGILLFENGDFDLVLCDLQLPDMSGTDVTSKLRETRESIEVIIISGYGSVVNAVAATKAGAFHFVEKPFEFDALQVLIERALERKTLIAESDQLRRTLQQRTTYSDIVGRSKVRNRCRTSSR